MTNKKVESSNTTNSNENKNQWLEESKFNVYSERTHTNFEYGSYKPMS